MSEHIATSPSCPNAYNDTIPDLQEAPFMLTIGSSEIPPDGSARTTLELWGMFGEDEDDAANVETGVVVLPTDSPFASRIQKRLGVILPKVVDADHTYIKIGAENNKKVEAVRKALCNRVAICPGAIGECWALGENAMRDVALRLGGRI